MLTDHDKFKKHTQLLLMGPKSNVQEYSLHLYINTHKKGEIEVIYEWLFIGGEGEERRGVALCMCFSPAHFHCIMCNFHKYVLRSA